MEGCCLLACFLVYSLALSLAYYHLAFIHCHSQGSGSSYTSYQPSQFPIDMTTCESDSSVEVLSSQVTVGFVRLTIQLTRTTDKTQQNLNNLKWQGMCFQTTV